MLEKFDQLGKAAENAQDVPPLKALEELHGGLANATNEIQEAKIALNKLTAFPDAAVLLGGWECEKVLDSALSFLNALGGALDPLSGTPGLTSPILKAEKEVAPGYSQASSDEDRNPIQKVAAEPVNVIMQWSPEQVKHIEELITKVTETLTAVTELTGEIKKQHDDLAKVAAPEDIEEEVPVEAGETTPENAPPKPERENWIARLGKTLISRRARSYLLGVGGILALAIILYGIARLLPRTAVMPTPVPTPVTEIVTETPYTRPSTDNTPIPEGAADSKAADSCMLTLQVDPKDQAIILSKTESCQMESMQGGLKLSGQPLSLHHSAAGVDQGAVSGIWEEQDGKYAFQLDPAAAPSTGNYTLSLYAGDAPYKQNNDVLWNWALAPSCKLGLVFDPAALDMVVMVGSQPEISAYYDLPAMQLTVQDDCALSLDQGVLSLDGQPVSVQTALRKDAGAFDAPVRQNGTWEQVEDNQQKFYLWKPALVDDQQVALPSQAEGVYQVSLSQVDAKEPLTEKPVSLEIQKPLESASTYAIGNNKANTVDIYVTLWPELEAGQPEPGLILQSNNIIVPLGFARVNDITYVHWRLPKSRMAYWSPLEDLLFGISFKQITVENLAEYGVPEIKKP